MNAEEIRIRLSDILENASQEHPMKVYIPIETGEEVGLSSLELPTINNLWIEPGTGTIRFRMYGIDDIQSLDDHEDWMFQVLDYFILGSSPIDNQIF